MWSILARLLTSLSRGFLKNALTGAGIMLATYATVMLAFNQALDALRGSMNGIPANVMVFISMAGFDQGISIILGAMATRIALNSDKLFIKKATQ